MFTTTTEDGLLNNYAIEPQIYYSNYPSPEQQREYVKQAAISALIVVSAILVAFVAS